MSDVIQLTMRGVPRSEALRVVEGYELAVKQGYVGSVTDYHSALKDGEPLEVTRTSGPILTELQDEPQPPTLLEQIRKQSRGAGLGDVDVTQEELRAVVVPGTGEIDQQGLQALIKRKIIPRARSLVPNVNAETLSGIIDVATQDILPQLQDAARTLAPYVKKGVSETLAFLEPLAERMVELAKEAIADASIFFMENIAPALQELAVELIKEVITAVVMIIVEVIVGIVKSIVSAAPAPSQPKTLTIAAELRQTLTDPRFARVMSGDEDSFDNGILAVRNHTGKPMPDLLATVNAFHAAQSYLPNDDDFDRLFLESQLRHAVLEGFGVGQNYEERALRVGQDQEELRRALESLRRRSQASTLEEEALLSAIRSLPPAQQGALARMILAPPADGGSDAQAELLQRLAREQLGLPEPQALSSTQVMLRQAYSDPRVVPGMVPLIQQMGQAGMNPGGVPGGAVQPQGDINQVLLSIIAQQQEMLRQQALVDFNEAQRRALVEQIKRELAPQLQGAILDTDVAPLGSVSADPRAQRAVMRTSSGVSRYISKGSEGATQASQEVIRHGTSVVTQETMRTLRDPEFQRMSQEASRRAAQAASKQAGKAARSAISSLKSRKDKPSASGGSMPPSGAGPKLKSRCEMHSAARRPQKSGARGGASKRKKKRYTQQERESLHYGDKFPCHPWPELDDCTPPPGQSGGQATEVDEDFDLEPFSAGAALEHMMQDKDFHALIAGDRLSYECGPFRFQNPSGEPMRDLAHLRDKYQRNPGFRALLVGGPLDDFLKRRSTERTKELSAFAVFYSLVDVSEGGYAEMPSDAFGVARALLEDLNDKDLLSRPMERKKRAGGVAFQILEAMRQLSLFRVEGEKSVADRYPMLPVGTAVFTEMLDAVRQMHADLREQGEAARQPRPASVGADFLKQFTRGLKKREAKGATKGDAESEEPEEPKEPKEPKEDVDPRVVIQRGIAKELWEASKTVGTRSVYAAAVVEEGVKGMGRALEPPYAVRLGAALRFFALVMLYLMDGSDRMLAFNLVAYMTEYLLHPLLAVEPGVWQAFLEEISRVDADLPRINANYDAVQVAMSHGKREALHRKTSVGVILPADPKYRQLLALSPYALKHATFTTGHLGLHDAPQDLPVYGPKSRVYTWGQNGGSLRVSNPVLESMVGEGEVRLNLVAFQPMEGLGSVSVYQQV